MKNLLKLMVVFFTCAFIVSCQKEIDETPDPIEPPVITPDSATVVSRLVYFDFRVSTTDTTGYTDYVYDNLKRVTAVNYYEFDDDEPALSETLTYYYNGNDTLAYKMVDTDVAAPGLDETYFYFYDGSQRLIKDSTIYTEGTEVNQYDYSGTMIIDTWNGITFNPADTYSGKDTGFSGATGDVIKTYSYPSAGESYIENFTYDNNPNPFYQLNIRSTYNPLPGYDFFIESNYLQKNNVVLISTENTMISGSADTNTFTYTYNALGFPASVDVTYGSVQTDDYRIIFVYKKI